MSLDIMRAEVRIDSHVLRSNSWLYDVKVWWELR